MEIYNKKITRDKDWQKAQTNVARETKETALYQRYQNIHSKKKPSTMTRRKITHIEKDITLMTIYTTPLRIPSIAGSTNKSVSRSLIHYFRQRHWLERKPMLGTQIWVICTQIWVRTITRRLRDKFVESISVTYHAIYAYLLANGSSLCAEHIFHVVSMSFFWNINYVTFFLTCLLIPQCLWFWVLLYKFCEVWHHSLYVNGDFCYDNFNTADKV